jgi:hypothetical protein
MGLIDAKTESRNSRATVPVYYSKISSLAHKISIRILCANYRNLLESGAERWHPQQCGWDTHWCSRFQSFVLRLPLRIPRYRQYCCLPDSKLEYGVEQCPSKWELVLLRKISTLKIHRNLRADQKNLKTRVCIATLRGLDPYLDNIFMRLSL